MEQNPVGEFDLINASPPLHVILICMVNDKISTVFLSMSSGFCPCSLDYYQQAHASFKVGASVWVQSTSLFGYGKGRKLTNCDRFVTSLFGSVLRESVTS